MSDSGTTPRNVQVYCESRFSMLFRQTQLNVYGKGKSRYPIKVLRGFWAPFERSALALRNLSVIRGWIGEYARKQRLVGIQPSNDQERAHPISTAFPRQ
jgi:hypothetical protein